jgi:gamma-tubulin complex component 3
MTRLDRTRDQARGVASSPSAEYDTDLKSTSQLNSILKRLAVLKSDFKSRMDLITQLTAQHQDLDIRFLAIRLAFNGFWGKKERDRDGKSRPSRKA